MTVTSSTSRIVGLAIVAVAACRAPTPFEVQEEPFDGAFGGDFTFQVREVDEASGEVRQGDLRIQAAGEATHLGPGQVAGDLRVDFREEPAAVTGELAVIDEGGDTLSLSLTGTAAPDGRIGGLELAGSFQFAGGSGRYALVRGGGTFAGGTNLVTDRGDVATQGVVSF